MFSFFIKALVRLPIFFLAVFIKFNLFNHGKGNCNKKFVLNDVVRFASYNSRIFIKI